MNNLPKRTKSNVKKDIECVTEHVVMLESFLTWCSPKADACIRSQICSQLALLAELEDYLEGMSRS